MKNFLHILFLFVTLFFGTVLNSFSQLIISNNNNIQSLIQDVLIGPGITVNNINFVGHPESVASFNGVNSNIGLQSGIIMSTGRAADARGPNNRNVGTSNNQPGDTTLNNILTNNEQTIDAVSIEFDFIPTANNLTFRMVFGSEEYPGFIDQGFNDVFGFFISGPGFNGQENIALVPGTTIPISIKSINPLVNNQFYVNNDNGTSVQFNGFTTVLEITIHVEACKEYHIKLAIADVKDPVFDSGIFIEAGSFTSVNEKEVSIQRIYPAIPDLLSEGCDSAVFLVRRLSSNTTNSVDVNINFRGTAQENIDFTSNIQNQKITIPSGANTARIILKAPTDIVAEGLESIIIDLVQPDICKSYSDSILIKDYFPPLITKIVDEGCRDDRTLYTVLYKNGSNTIHITWQDSAGNVLDINENASLILTQPMWVYVTITDECTGIEVKDSVFITPKKAFHLSLPTTTTVCPGTYYQINTDFVDSTLTDYTIEWIPNTGLSTDTILNPIAYITGDIEYTLKLTHPNYCPFEGSFTIFVIEMGASQDEIYVCKGGNGMLSAIGGDIYTWTNKSGDILSQNKDLEIFPDSSLTVYLTISDTVNLCNINDSVQVLVDTIPIANAGPDKITCSRQTITLSASGSKYDTYEWFPKSSIENPYDANPNVTPLITTTYYVKAINRACFSYDSVIVYVADASSANFDIQIDTCERIIHVRNPVDSIFYYWDLGDGNYSNEQTFSYTYSSMGTYTLKHNVNIGSPCEDSMSTVLNFNLGSDSLVKIPTAFTPNGDGKHDVFSPIGERIYCEIERMMIFDRWGLMIFDSQERNSLQWDGTYKGKKVVSAAYIYVIQGKGFSQKGTISVIY